METRTPQYETKVSYLTFDIVSTTVGFPCLAIETASKFNRAVYKYKYGETT